MASDQRLKVVNLFVLCFINLVWTYHVMDPTGKWNRKEIQIIQDCMERWQHPLPDKHPPPPLTDRQSAWFYSLGCNNQSATHGHGFKSRDNSGSSSSGSRSSEEEKERTTSFDSSHRAIRKEIRQLTRSELDRYNRAIKAMRDNYPDPNESRSEYEIIVSYHRHSRAPGAHIGPAFLPWHREYLWRFEMALRQHEPLTAIPYWDATLDQPLPEPRDSIMFSEHLIGNSNGRVTTGPYADFSVLPECEEHGRTLTRELVPNPEGGVFLYSKEDIDYVMNKKLYRDLIVPFDTKFEDDHGAAHVYVGGHMKDLTCAGSDPIFWLLHSFIDCVWENFRINSQTSKPELDFPSEDHEEYTEFHKPYHIMEPFHPMYNIHGLSNHYFNYYTECSPMNGNCRRDKDCESEFLWCDRDQRRCKSKIRPDGDCTGLDDVACYGDNMRCRNHRCVDRRSRDQEPKHSESKEESNEASSREEIRMASRENSRSTEMTRKTDSSKSNERTRGNSRSDKKSRSNERSKENSIEESEEQSASIKSREGNTGFPYYPWHPFMQRRGGDDASYDLDSQRSPFPFFRPHRIGKYFGRRRRR